MPLETPAVVSFAVLGAATSTYGTIAFASALFRSRFPLSTKGKEKVQFNYGVYLLNKNIAQVTTFFLPSQPSCFVDSLSCHAGPICVPET